MPAMSGSTTYSTVMCEGFDEPVDHQCQVSPSGFFAHIFHCRPVDLDHHGINHDPDEDRHHQADVAQPQAHADAHAHATHRVR